MTAMATMGLAAGLDAGAVVEKAREMVMGVMAAAMVPVAMALEAVATMACFLLARTALAEGAEKAQPPAEVWAMTMEAAVAALATVANARVAAPEAKAMVALALVAALVTEAAVATALATVVEGLAVAVEGEATVRVGWGTAVAVAQVATMGTMVAMRVAVWVAVAWVAAALVETRAAAAAFLVTAREVAAQGHM